MATDLTPAEEPVSKVEELAVRRTGRSKVYARAFLRDPVTLLACVALLVIVLVGIFWPLLAPHDPYQQNLGSRLLPPGSPSPVEGEPGYLLGTDELGRDLLSRLMLGARVSLSVGVTAVIFSGTIGVTLGLLAGFFRGRTEELIMRITDLQMAFPALILALFVLFAIGPGFGNVLIVMALIRWPVYARISRSIALGLGGAQYIESARALGASRWRILREHIFPNALSPVLILGTLELAFMIMFEATLSFLGFGVQPPDTSWGLMISVGRNYMFTGPWIVIAPGVVLLIAALSINLIASWAQNVTDPLQRARWLRKGIKT